MAIKMDVDYSEFQQFERDFKLRLVDNWSQVVTNSLTQCAEQYLKDLIKATPVDTGKLKRQWRKDNGNISKLAVKVKEVYNGYEIQLVNTTNYASWVEKGHYSYNQFGGPYPVRNAKVPDSSGWVYGRFFVKKTEVKWQDGKLDAALQRRINSWMKELLSG